MEETNNAGEGKLDFKSEELTPSVKESEESTPTDNETEEAIPTENITSNLPPAESAEEATEPGKVKVQTTQFAPMTDAEGGFQAQGNIGMLVDLQLPISVELGRVNMLIKDILELGPGAVVELNKFSGEPVDIYVNNKKFAEGEVVVVDQNFGVRILALIGPNERLMNIQ